MGLQGSDIHKKCLLGWNIRGVHFLFSVKTPPFFSFPDFSQNSCACSQILGLVLMCLEPTSNIFWLRSFNVHSHTRFVIYDQKHPESNVAISFWVGPKSFRFKGDHHFFKYKWATYLGTVSGNFLQSCLISSVFWITNIKHILYK